MKHRQLRNAAATVYNLHPDVVWIARPDGSSRLMHMSDNVCAIDADATAWLKSIIAVGPDRTASELAAHYGVDETQVREDVQSFLIDLCKQKLLQRLRQRRSPLESARDTTARVLVPGVLGLVDRLTRQRRGRARGLLWAARWAVAQFGWARAVRAWEHAYPQPTGERPRSTEELDAIDRAVRDMAARSLLSVECKERALTCLALARTSGIVTHLVVGMTHNPLQGHVWVEAQGRIISDNPEHCRAFEPVARYG